MIVINILCDVMLWMFCVWHMPYTHCSHRELFPSSTIFDCRHNGSYGSSVGTVEARVESDFIGNFVSFVWILHFPWQSTLLPRWQFNWSATIWLWIIFIKKIQPFSPSTNNSRHQSSGARHTDKSLKKCQRECKNRRIEATQKKWWWFFFLWKKYQKKQQSVQTNEEWDGKDEIIPFDRSTWIARKRLTNCFRAPYGFNIYR